MKLVFQATAKMVGVREYNCGGQVFAKNKLDAVKYAKKKIKSVYEKNGAKVESIKFHTFKEG